MCPAPPPLTFPPPPTVQQQTCSNQPCLLYSTSLHPIHSPDQSSDPYLIITTTIVFNHSYEQKKTLRKSRPSRFRQKRHVCSLIRRARSKLHSKEEHRKTTKGIKDRAVIAPNCLVYSSPQHTHTFNPGRSVLHVPSIHFSLPTPRTRR